MRAALRTMTVKESGLDSPGAKEISAGAGGAVETSHIRAVRYRLR